MTTALLSEKTVQALLGVSRTTMRRWAANGYGPIRKKLGPRRVGYRADEVEAFIDALRTQSPEVASCESNAA